MSQQVQDRIDWRERFLAERRTGIGGSDIAAIVGIDPRRDALDVWRRFAGLEEDDLSDVAAIRRGSRLEVAVLDEYEDIQGVALVRNPPLARANGAPHRLAHADALIFDEVTRGVEAKTAAGAAADDFGANGTDEVPRRYVLQCQWYMGVYGAPSWDVAAMLSGHFRFEFRFYRIHRNDRLIGLLNAHADRFWERHVVTGVAPDPSNAASAARHAMALYPSDVEPLLSTDDHAIAERLRAWRAARAAKDAAVKADEEHANAFRALIGPAAGIEVPGVGRVTWKTNKAGARPLRPTWLEEDPE